MFGRHAPDHARGAAAAAPQASTSLHAACQQWHAAAAWRRAGGGGGAESAKTHTKCLKASWRSCWPPRWAATWTCQRTACASRCGKVGPCRPLRAHVQRATPSAARSGAMAAAPLRQPVGCVHAHTRMHTYAHPPAPAHTHTRTRTRTRTPRTPRIARARRARECAAAPRGSGAPAAAHQRARGLRGQAAAAGACGSVQPSPLPCPHGTHCTPSRLASTLYARAQHCMRVAHASLPHTHHARPASIHPIATRSPPPAGPMGPLDGARRPPHH